jgi:predicted GNAT family acetyltransferase
MNAKKESIEYGIVDDVFNQNMSKKLSKENDTRGVFYGRWKRTISELTYTKQKNGVLVIDHTETRTD